jgi:hypothetical protein
MKNSGIKSVRLSWEGLKSSQNIIYIYKITNRLINDTGKSFDDNNHFHAKNIEIIKFKSNINIISFP